MRIHLIINNNFSVLFFVLLVFCFSSCITTKDLEYINSTSEINDVNITYKDYLLQKGDLISVQISTTTEQQHDFFNKETNSSQLLVQNPYFYGYIVEEDGFLELPSFGRIKAEGFSLRELESVIKQIALSYFEKPVVRLNITNFDVSVLGEVNSPGTYNIKDPQTNILQVLSRAGDMTEYGNRKKIKVIREYNNSMRVFFIDITSKDILGHSDFMLQPHDIVYVAPLEKKFYVISDFSSAISLLVSTVTLFLLINNN